MAKLTLTDVESNFASITKINANWALIEAALENTLSRDGTSPNGMSADLDMDSNRILNLPDAVSNQEPATLSQVTTMAGGSGPVSSVFGRTGAILAVANDYDADEIDDTSTTNKFTTAANLAKLAGIEASATADQSDAEIETAYNNQVSQVSAGEKTAGTESAIRRFSPQDVADMAGTHGGGGGAVSSVFGRTGAVLAVANDYDADEIDDTSTTNKFTTAANLSKLAGIESSATADQSDAEIETAYNNQVAQVSGAERTAGTETAIRRYSPADIASMAGTHGGGGGSTTFIGLTDTPANYSGDANKILAVNAGETAVEFIDPSVTGSGGSELTFSPPTTSTLSVAQNSASGVTATATDVSGKGLHLECDNTAGGDKHVRRVKTVPGSTPYTITARLHFTPNLTQNASGGILIRNDTSGEETRLFMLHNGLVYMQQWTNDSFGAGLAGPKGIENHHVWLRLNNDGTDITGSFSYDGETWIELSSHTVASHVVTPSHHGVYVRVNTNGENAGILVPYFSET